MYVKSLDNPGCAQSRITVQYDDQYDLFCGMDYQNNLPDEAESTKVVADFVGIFAYSIEDCLYACSNANHFQGIWKVGLQTCLGVTWNFNMASSNSSDNANCFIKNGTSSGIQCNNCISAKLVTS